MLLTRCLLLGFIATFAVEPCLARQQPQNTEIFSRTQFNNLEPSLPTFSDAVVVGSGLSGLVAALDLAKSGLSVVVLEAQSSVGGRSQRIEALSDTSTPLWVDEGGMWVGSTQTEFLKLISDLGLTLYPSAHTKGQTSLYWNGTFFNSSACWDCLVLPGARGDIETASSLLSAAASAPEWLRPELLELITVMAELAEVAATVDVAAPWRTPHAADLDAMTFKTWVESKTDSPLARSMLYLAVEMQGATNAQPHWTSVLHVARQLKAAPQPQRPEAFLVKGGAGQIPGKLAAELKAYGDQVFTSSPVRVIHQRTGDVGLNVRVESDSVVVDARAVIVAMPPHLAGRIEYLPGMPPMRDQLTQRMPMGSLVKCVAIYSTAFWRGGGQSYHQIPDVPLLPFGYFLEPEYKPGDASASASSLSRSQARLAYDISPPETVGGGGAGVLATFLPEHAGSGSAPSTPEERKQRVLESFVRWYGPQAAHPIEFIEKAWPEEKYVGGAFTSVMPPGGWTQFGPALTAPVGLIHWAGTETSSKWPGFYEGAVHAGRRAAAAVITQLAKESSSMT